MKVNRQPGISPKRKQTVLELLINRLRNSLEVPQHVSSTEKHGCRVGNVPSHCLCKRVASSLEEKEAGNEEPNKYAVIKNCS